MIYPDKKLSKKYYDSKQVASIFNVTDATIRNMIHRGDIQAIRVGRLWRISEEEVLKIPKAFKKD